MLLLHRHIKKQASQGVIVTKIHKKNLCTGAMPGTGPGVQSLKKLMNFFSTLLIEKRMKTVCKRLLAVFVKPDGTEHKTRH